LLVKLNTDLYAVIAEPDWIAEFAKKQELAEKASKLKVMKSSCVDKHTSPQCGRIDILTTFVLFVQDKDYEKKFT